jgi:taurine dioxygenase
MPDEDAITLIQYLSEHCIQERFIYRHKWQVGDVLMWDNCAAQHKAIEDYQLPQVRLMHRTTVNGTAPY